MTARRITIDANIHFGQPCVAGTRISVYTALELVQAGIPFDEIVRDYYPDLTVDDVKACVEYAINLINRTYAVANSIAQHD